MELFVNGKSCGKKNVENCLAVFDVVLPFGSSTLEEKVLVRSSLAMLAGKMVIQKM